MLVAPGILSEPARPLARVDDRAVALKMGCSGYIKAGLHTRSAKNAPEFPPQLRGRGYPKAHHPRLLLVLPADFPTEIARTGQALDLNLDRPSFPGYRHAAKPRGVAIGRLKTTFPSSNLFHPYEVSRHRANWSVLSPTFRCLQRPSLRLKSC